MAGKTVKAPGLFQKLNKAIFGGMQEKKKKAFGKAADNIINMHSGRNATGAKKMKAKK